MADLRKPLKLFFLFCSPFFVTPYTVKNNKIQTSFVKKLISILVLNFLALHELYKYSYKNVPADLLEDPYLFIGYLRSVFLASSTLVMTVMISKNHEKITECATRLLELTEKFNNEKFTKIKIFLGFATIWLYISAFNIFYGYWFRSSNFFQFIIVAFIDTVKLMANFIAEFYFLTLIIILYSCVDLANKNLENFKPLDSIPILKERIL